MILPWLTEHIASTDAWPADKAAIALNSIMPKTLNTISVLCGRSASLHERFIPSSLTGKRMEFWNPSFRNIDSDGLPTGILVQFGGILEKLDGFNASSEFQALEDGLLQQTRHGDFWFPPHDDCSLTITREPNAKLSMRVEVLMDRHFFYASSMTSLAIEIEDMFDEQLEAFFVKAFLSSVVGSDAQTRKDALLSLANMARAEGFHRSLLSWKMPNTEMANKLIGVAST